MPVALSYMPLMQFMDANGSPISFARVYSYHAGTSMPLSLYTDPTGLVPHPQGVQSDGGGRLLAYMTLGLAYKLNVLDANHVQVPGWPIDNLAALPSVSPTLLPSHSTTVAEQALTMDPGEPGTEHLAATMAQEIEQLRFRIGEMTGVPWNQTHTTRYQPVYVTTEPPSSGLWVPGGVSHIHFWFYIPSGWQAGTPLGLRWYSYAHIPGGQADFLWMYQRHRHGVGGAGSGITPFPVSYPDNTTTALIFVFDPSAYQSADAGVVTITRAAPDSNTGAISLVGAMLEYQGVGSR